MVITEGIVRMVSNINIKNIILIFGVPNFFSLVFFLKALGSMDSSIVFPLVSIGVVVSSSLIGIIIFKENLSRSNWIGIILSVCAIYLFSY